MPSRAPLAGRRVEIWDRDLIFDDKLASGTTDDEGRFGVEIEGPRFVDAFFDRRADVFFRVFDADTLVLDTRASTLCNLRLPADVTLEVPVPIADVPDTGELDADDVVMLRDLSGLTLDELAARQPRLYGRVVALALEELRARLLAAIRTNTQELRAHLAKLDLRPLLSERRTLEELIRKSVDGADEPLREQGLAFAVRDDLPDVGTILSSKTRLADNSLFGHAFTRADMRRLGTWLQLPDPTLVQLEKRGAHPGNLDDEKLGMLVDAGVLDGAAAARLGSHATMFRLVDGDLAKAIAIVARTEAALGKPFAHLRDVAVLSAAQLADVLGTDGARISRTIERMFPDDVLRSRLVQGQLSPGKRALARLLDVDRQRPLVGLDTFDRDAMKTVAPGDLTVDERAAAIGELRRMQRLLRVTGGNTDAALQLADAGHDSAIQMVHANATIDPAYRSRVDDVVANMLGPIGVMFDWFDRTRQPVPSDDVADEIHDLAHYFGNQSYCHCKHCQSIVSPAAYYVDLMEYVEREITTTAFGAANPTDDASLYRRRRDLWTGVPLTCAATHDLEPTLAIVNEILENHLDGVAEPTPGLDRGPVETRVYRLLHERGTASAPELDSFAQPFSLPLARVRAYLADPRSRRSRRHDPRRYAGSSGCRRACAVGDERSDVRDRRGVDDEL